MSKVIVVGSINMDIVALSERHPAAGETVSGRELHLLPGGKGANQAVAARRGGVLTLMVGRLGEDAFALKLRTFLEEEGVDLTHVRSVAGSSGTALVTVAGAENTIVVIKGANDRLTPADVLDLPFEAGDVVLAQFEVPQETIAAAFEVARARDALTVLNPAPAEDCEPRLLALTDVLLVNESELCALLGRSGGDEMTPASALAGARELQARVDQIVIVTLGRAGAVALAGEQAIEIEGHRVEAVDTTGAGDCFAGNLAAELSRGSDLERALQTANSAASLCVQTLGASVSMPRLEATAGAL